MLIKHKMQVTLPCIAIYWPFSAKRNCGYQRTKMDVRSTY